MILLCLLLQDVRGEFGKLSSPDVEVRQAAEAALVAMGEDVIAPLERLAAGADAETRGRVADVVRRLRWWDHVVFFRGRRIDLRQGRVQATDFGVHAKVVGSRIVDVAAGRAVDFRSGRELWKADLELGAEIWGVEAGETSLVARVPAGLACVDAATGRILWRAAGRWPRVAHVAGGDWIVQDDRGASRMGATAWTVKAAGPSLVAAAGPWAMVGAEGTSTKVLDLRDGSELRTLEKPRVHRAVEAGEGRVLLVGERTLRALRTSDAAVLWTKPEAGEASAPLVEGGRVYVADHHAMCCSIKLYALDVATGAPLWTAPATGIPTSHSKYRHEARLARVGPYLVLLGTAAAGDYVEAFEPATGRLVSRWTSK